MVLAATAQFTAYDEALHTPLRPWAPAWADGHGRSQDTPRQKRSASPGGVGVLDGAREQVGHELGGDRVDVSPATAAQGPRSRT